MTIFWTFDTPPLCFVRFASIDYSCLSAALPAVRYYSDPAGRCLTVECNFLYVWQVAVHGMFS